MRTVLSLLVLASAGLMAGGCATAGLALVGPLAGSLTNIVDRSVERTLPGDLSTTWGATTDALARMAVRVEQADKSGPKWQLSGTGEAVTVHGTLERVTASMTRVSVRVETGGLFADKKTGDELLNQIATSLTTLASMGRRDGATSGADGSSEQLRVLRQEIERLGTKIDQAREAPSPPSRPEAPSLPTVNHAPIIVIPASAGVATVPAADVSLTRPGIPSPLRGDAGPRDGKSSVHLRSVPGQGRERLADDIVPVPLTPVEVLRPVEALRIKPASP